MALPFFWRAPAQIYTGSSHSTFFGHLFYDALGIWQYTALNDKITRELKRIWKVSSYLWDCTRWATCHTLARNTSQWQMHRADNQDAAVYNEAFRTLLGTNRQYSRRLPELRAQCHHRATWDAPKGINFRHANSLIKVTRANGIRPPAFWNNLCAACRHKRSFSI